MYAQVKLLNGFSESFTYTIPSHLAACKVGTLVRIPLKARFVTGVIVRIDHTIKQRGYAIKPIQDIELLPDDPHYSPYIAQLAHYYQTDIVSLLARMRHFVTQEQQESEPVPAALDDTHQVVMLTNEQQAVVDFVTPHIITPSYCPTLVHGVTGSGKTEIYKQLIMAAISQGKVAVLMLPEVTLALRFEHLLRKQLPNSLAIFGFHSASTTKEKKLLWQLLLEKKPMLIIGVHLPMLLPIPNLGIIIIDEEHELGYQEKKHPKINSKEAALLRAYMGKIPIVLGSATPSLTSLYHVKSKGWHFFQLKHRFAGAFPKITLVELAKSPIKRNFWISPKLEVAIADRLKKQEQCIIFLNRRGYSFFVQCKKCSFIFTCDNCSVSLTLHDNKTLNCHYCSLAKTLAPICPGCKASEDNFIKKGIGTQQVVSILQQLFPKARIARGDLDTTTKKKAWHKIVSDFEQGNLDILVGTQTVTKGYHFTKVTLVGILWADLNLHFPVYHAVETTLQQIIQVAGRAGRASMESEVIIQTMINHPVFNHVSEKDYLSFYDEELSKRQMVGYPPTLRLVEIELKHTDEPLLEKEAQDIANSLIELVLEKQWDINVLGPAKPPVYKIKNMQSRKIYLKAAHISHLIELYKTIDHRRYTSSIYFTPSPTS